MEKEENKADGGEQGKRKKCRRSNSPADECLRPMEVPDHIYVAGEPRQRAKSETKPQMVVPSRITVAGGDTTVASKAQPVEVLRERQTLLQSSDSVRRRGGMEGRRTTDTTQPNRKFKENIGMNGIPDMLTANELPQEGDTTHNTSELMAAQCYEPTSVVVDKDPLKELKVTRRRLIQLSRRVSHLETQSEQSKKEMTFMLGFVSVSTLLSIALFASHVRVWLNR